MKPAEHLRAASVSYRIRPRLLPHAPTHAAYGIRLCALLIQVLKLDADRLRLMPHTPTSDTADAACALRI
jgi:hypothetical protein